MDFGTLSQIVESEHERTGDAVMEIAHRLDHAEQMAGKWEDVLKIANTKHKQRRQWARKHIQSMQRVKHLTDLLSTARTIICEDCGHIIDENHQVVPLYGGGFEPDEDTCEINGVPASEHVPF